MPPLCPLRTIQPPQRTPSLGLLLTGPAQPSNCLGCIWALCDTLFSSHSRSQAGSGQKGPEEPVPAQLGEVPSPHSVCSTPCAAPAPRASVLPPLLGLPSKGVTSRGRGGARGRWERQGSLCTLCAEPHLCESPSTSSCPTLPKGLIRSQQGCDNEQAHSPLWGPGPGWGAGDPPWDWGMFWESPAFPRSLQGGRSPTELWAHRTQLQLSLAPGDTAPVPR